MRPDLATAISTFAADLERCVGDVRAASASPVGTFGNLKDTIIRINRLTAHFSLTLESHEIDAVADLVAHHPR